MPGKLMNWLYSTVGRSSKHTISSREDTRYTGTSQPVYSKTEPKNESSFIPNNSKPEKKPVSSKPEKGSKKPEKRDKQPNRGTKSHRKGKRQAPQPQPEPEPLLDAPVAKPIICDDVSEFYNSSESHENPRSSGYSSVVDEEGSSVLSPVMEEDLEWNNQNQGMEPVDMEEEEEEEEEDEEVIFEEWTEETKVSADYAMRVMASAKGDTKEVTSHLVEVDLHTEEHSDVTTSSEGRGCELPPLPSSPPPQGIDIDQLRKEIDGEGGKLLPKKEKKKVASSKPAVKAVSKPVRKPIAKPVEPEEDFGQYLLDDDDDDDPTWQEEHDGEEEYYSEEDEGVYYDEDYEEYYDDYYEEEPVEEAGVKNIYNFSYNDSKVGAADKAGEVLNDNETAGERIKEGTHWWNVNTLGVKQNQTGFDNFLLRTKRVSSHVEGTFGGSDGEEEDSMDKEMLKRMEFNRTIQNYGTVSKPMRELKEKNKVASGFRKAMKTLRGMKKMKTWDVSDFREPGRGGAIENPLMSIATPIDEFQVLY